jgi:hypothetical protein
MTLYKYKLFQPWTLAGPQRIIFGMNLENKVFKGLPRLVPYNTSIIGIDFPFRVRSGYGGI